MQPYNTCAGELTLADLTERVASNETRLSGAKNRVSDMEDCSNSHSSQLAALEKRAQLLQSKVDDLENRGRRKNIKIVGLPEQAEGSTPLAEFLCAMLPKSFGLPSGFAPEIEHAHRSLAPAPPERGPPRSVLVRFLRYPDKETVLRAAPQKRRQLRQFSKIRLCLNYQLLARSGCWCLGPKTAVRQKRIESYCMRRKFLTDKHLIKTSQNQFLGN
uniref:L1 transposable element RRM domain-containing protein n=1 Tax=Astyanax mexicanus TaxID=7994 RepID=A0A8B9GU86_ASTMX